MVVGDVRLAEFAPEIVNAVLIIMHTS